MPRVRSQLGNGSVKVDCDDVFLQEPKCFSGVVAGSRHKIANGADRARLGIVGNREIGFAVVVVADD